MNIYKPKQKILGFTAIDLLIVVATVAILVIWFYQWDRWHRKTRYPRSNCVSNLKQVGLAFRMWANDHDGQFPWLISTNQGGTKEWVASGEAFHHFLAMSNELNTPKVLYCSQDITRIKTNQWAAFNNASLSYFVGLDADETKPQSILSGDRSLTTSGTLRTGPLTIATNSPVNWAPGLHQDCGTLAFGDGSAQQYTTPALKALLQKNPCLPARLVLP